MITFLKILVYLAGGGCRSKFLLHLTFPHYPSVLPNNLFSLDKIKQKKKEQSSLKYKEKQEHILTKNFSLKTCIKRQKTVKFAVPKLSIHCSIQEKTLNYYLIISNDCFATIKKKAVFYSSLVLFLS